MIPNSKTYDEQYEERLVERFRQGEAAAVTTLFEMYAERTFGLARHLTGNREDAEEIVSEAFFKAFRNVRSYRGESSFRIWLFTIVHNLSRDRQRQKQLILITDLDEEMVDTNVLSPPVLAQQADVRSAMNELSDDYREVLILCDVEEWDAVEAAQLLKRTPASTRSLLYRARRALRDILTAKWSEENSI